MIGLIIITIFSRYVVGDKISDCVNNVLVNIELHSVAPVNDNNYLNNAVKTLCREFSDFKDFGKFNTNCSFGSPCYSKYQKLFQSYFKEFINGVYELYTTDKETHLFYRNNNPCRDPKEQYWVLKNNKSIKICSNGDNCENLGPHQYYYYGLPTTNKC